MKSDVVCPPFAFRPTGKSYSSLMNRYKLGKVRNSTLVLDPYECVFLMSLGKIAPETKRSVEEIIRHFDESGNFSGIFTAYFAIKKAGFYARVEGTQIYIRKRPSDSPVTVSVYTDSNRSSVPLLSGTEEKLSAVVDMDGDITIFATSSAELKGNSIEQEERSVSGLGEEGRWPGYSRGSLKLFSDIENRKTGQESSSKPDCTRYLVYSDLTDKGLILKSGFKYGADFRAYVGRESEHAEYLINIIVPDIPWSDISRIVRVSTAVRKKAIMAFEEADGLHYVLARRLKDFNSLYSDQIWASKSSTVGLKSE